MAFKFEIIGTALVITDTVSGDVFNEFPSRDLYFDNFKLLNDDKVVLYDTNGTNKNGSVVFEKDLVDCVDSGLTPFTESTFRDFGRASLGKSSGIAIDANGTVTLGGGLIFGTSETVAISANTDNLEVPNIEKVVLIRLNPDGNYDLTGIIPADITKAQMVIVTNIGTGNIIFKDNDAGSTAENRFLIGGNRTVQSDEGIAFVYDPVSKRWRSSSINI